MEIALAVFLFVIGIVLIVKGGDFFVDAASWIATVSGIPKFIVGATIVSVATTLPELFVSIMAAVQGSTGMAVGNAVGSVTVNVGLIMGISMIAMPGTVKRGSVLLKSVIMIVSCAMLWIFSSGGQFAYVGSVVLLCMFVAFIAENIFSARKEMLDADTDDEGFVANSDSAERGAAAAQSVAKDRRSVITNTVKFIAGAAGIVLGAQLLVDNGKILAAAIGVPEAIIGVTVVALGTSLPELVTTITAIVKKESSLSVGNILGANIIDLTLIMPLCSIITGGGLPVDAQAATLDIPACLTILCIAMIPCLISRRFFRAQGIIMLCSYAVYLVLLFTMFM